MDGLFREDEMNNQTDLFQAEYQRLTLPATGLAVFVDGTLCGDLEPIEIVRGGWPDFGWARLVYHPGAGPDVILTSWENVEERFRTGAEIRLCQLYNRRPPEVVIADLPLFVGHIEDIEIRTNPSGETTEITAKDFSAALRRITVYGQRILRGDGSSVFLSGLETVFNPAGRGNAAAGTFAIDGKVRTIFSARTPGARPWNCADVIDYLLSEYLSRAQLYWPTVEQLLALTAGRSAQDLDATGLSLLEALHRCSQAAGVQFHFVPRLAETGPKQAIVFYRVECGRTVELNCQPKGERLNLSLTQIAAYHGKRRLYPITHRYIGQGDFKVYEATFELVKAWDPTLEGNNYYQFSPSTNPEFYRVKDVYRRWCLNEADDYTGEPYNQGQSYDFSPVFGNDAYASRRRRFWPALSTDAQSNSLGYLLEVSLDGGLQWSTYAHGFNNLLDECGIWLSSDQLDVYTWVAALKGTLRFRLTASVVSDERLTCVLADGPVGSAVPVVDRIITLPRQFRYRKVSARSVFAQAPRCGRPDETDDSASLHELVRRYRDTSAAVIETADVQSLTLALHFQPGDRVTSSPESRDLLNNRRDNRSLVWIDRVHMDFRNQCTNLRVVRQRVHEG